jgi:hypothetical protein
MIVYLNFMGEDFIAEVDYRVTYLGCAARTYGPPEDCYPAELPEWEIDSIFLLRDNADKPAGPAFKATGALFVVLANLDKINDKILEDIRDEADYRTGWHPF